MAKIIEMIVSPQGEVELQTKGFRGAECQNASKFLEDALGTVKTDDPTPEMRVAPLTEEAQVEQHE